MSLASRSPGDAALPAPATPPATMPAADPRRLSLQVPDASQFARSLGQALKARHAAGSAPPGHVELLNLMARALGHRNLQSLRAARPPQWPTLPVANEDRAAPPVLTDTARKALMQFDSRGRLLRWPNKYSVQKLAMWVLWTAFDGRRSYTEREVNAVLKAANTFGDHVTLRRELVNHRLMARKSDCSEYRKLPARPDDETRALLAAWRALQKRPPAPEPAPAALTAPAGAAGSGRARRSTRGCPPAPCAPAPS